MLNLGEFWQAPELTSVNREPMLSLSHLHSLSLDGTWRFQLLDHPRAPLSRRWSTIPVPGLWTMQQRSDGTFIFGDKPIYTNVQMPFDHLPPAVPKENPTGVYERDFEYNALWRGKRVILTLGGYESVAAIYLNNEFVGLTKDSRLHASFNITSYLVAGKNTLRIYVIKWSDATFIEDQDQWWHGGITRSINIHATEKVFIERLYTQTGLLADLKTGTLRVRAYINSIENHSILGWRLRAKVSGGPREVHFESELTKSDRPNWTEMTPAQRSASSEFFRGTYWDGQLPERAKAALAEIEPPAPGYIEFSGKIPGIKPWSAEAPNLYDLEFELVDPSGKVLEISSQRIGFRSVQVVGNELLVNGKPIIIYGVNRHDFNRETGRVLTRDLMRQDLLELKRWNFNAVRTSHYPNDPIFLDLCDELGFYVIDEANIESHAFQDSLCNDQRYLLAFTERVNRMAQRDIHHPSVIAWSLGNESGSGINHEAAAAGLRAFDSSRPLHYEGAIRGNWTIGQSLTDMVVPMYPEISAIASYAKSKRADRPLIMCEYSHAMGNSNGTLKEYWDLIHSTKGLQGGFIWEFWDHGLDQYLGKGKKRSAYGGDFGEDRHDGNFVCDGLFFPDRKPKPVLHEFKALAAPVEFSSTALGKITIFNKNFFEDLSRYSLHFEITRDGQTLDAGTLALAKISPRKRLTISIKSKELKLAGEGERFLNLSLRLRETLPWAQVGFEVAWGQIPLPSKPKAKPQLRPKLRPQAISGVLNNDLSNYLSKSGEILLPRAVSSPKLTLWRAPTDNDLIGHIATRWNEWGVRDLTIEDRQIKSLKDKVLITNSLITKAGYRVKHIQQLELIQDGLKITERVNIPKVLHDLARVGITFELPGEFDSMTWFGQGRHESASDRKLGLVHRWQAKVDELHTDYIKPQENGARADVRWLKLFNGAEELVTLTLDKPRFVTVSKYRSSDLADTSHNVDLIASGNTIVTIDAISRGVGTASCGPDTLEKYIIKPGEYIWSWYIQS